MDRLFWIVMAVIGGGLILLVANNDAGAVFGIENDTFASMLYLGVWGGVLAAAIAGSGMRFGHIARNLAVWLFVILCLMAGYQYRSELQDIASRITAGLIPGSPLSAVSEDEAVVSLDKRADGHFGVRAVVDGTTVHFRSTQVPQADAVQADARAAGIDTASLTYAVPIMAASGPARAARAGISTLSVGAIERHDMTVMIAESGLTQSLLGMDFLGSLAGFDVRGDRMKLID